MMMMMTTTTMMIQTLSAQRHQTYNTVESEATAVEESSCTGVACTDKV